MAITLDSGGKKYVRESLQRGLTDLCLRLCWMVVIVGSSVGWLSETRKVQTEGRLSHFGSQTLEIRHVEGNCFIMLDTNRLGGYHAPEQIEFGFLEKFTMADKRAGLKKVADTKVRDQLVTIEAQLAKILDGYDCKTDGWYANVDSARDAVEDAIYDANMLVDPATIALVNENSEGGDLGDPVCKFPITEEEIS